MSEPQDQGERVGPVARAQLWIACLALAIMMLVVVADVTLRFVFKTPIRGAYDVVSMALLVMVFFGMAPVIARRGEILIDLVDGILPEKVLTLLRLVTAAGTTAVLGFLFWAMIGPARDAWRYGDRSLELGVPVWTLWIAAFVGLAGVVLAAILRLVREVRG